MNPMVQAFIGISLALYGGATLAGVVTVMQRPFLFLAIMGEPLHVGFVRAGAVFSAVMVGAGYGVLRIGLSGIV